MTFQLDHALDLLARTPQVLRDLLAGLPEPWVYTNEGPDTFSPFDVVGHLIHGERTDWMARARLTLAPGGPHTYEPFDRFAHVEASRGKTMGELLDTFAALRAENLAALRALGLTEVDFEAEGRHPALGPVTLRQLLATWVVHDLSHLAQISRVMAKQYREEVGPWRAYLSVLDRP